MCVCVRARARACVGACVGACLCMCVCWWWWWGGVFGYVCVLGGREGGGRGGVLGGGRQDVYGPMGGDGWSVKVPCRPVVLLNFQDEHSCDSHPNPPPLGARAHRRPCEVHLR